MPSIAPHPPWVFFGVIGLLGFMIGLSKGGLSGLGLVLTPLLALIVQDVALAVVLLLPMLMVGDVFAVRAYWREWDSALLWRVLPAAGVGAILGVWLLGYLPPNGLRAALGVFTLLVVAYKYLSDRIQGLRYAPRPWHGVVAGSLTGLASGLFNSGGPPFNAYMLIQRLPPRVFVATAAIVFALLNLIKLVVLIRQQLLDAPRAQLALQLWWVVLFIPLGNWLGRRLITRIDRRAFDGLVSGLLVISGAWLLWQSLG